MQLERELKALAREIAWPPPPSQTPSFEPRSRDLRRPLLVAAAVVVVAVAAAFAVPQSRATILRFLHLGGVTIRFVDTLPAVQEQPLAATLGPTLSASQARGLLGGTLLLPPTSTAPPLHANGQIVSLIVLNRGQPILISEARTGSAIFLKKLASLSTAAASVRVETNPGLWLSGAPHVVFFPEAPARLAGNVLLWQHGPLTLRLEGKNLTQSQAIEVARSLH
jgi:hypothetical protein